MKEKKKKTGERREENGKEKRVEGDSRKISEWVNRGCLIVKQWAGGERVAG